MKSFGTALLLLSIALPAVAADPFKLGTFEREGEEILGILLDERHVVDLTRANASLERHHPLWVKLPMPEDMAELIGRYEYGMRERVHAIADAVRESLTTGATPAYVYELEGLDIAPPVQPGLILAAALNYWAHATEMTTGTPAEMSDASALDDKPVSMDHFWQRAPDDRRPRADGRADSL